MVRWINYVELEEKICAIEKELNVSFPNDFKDIIQKYNKGMPNPNKIPLGEDKYAVFDRLISFNKSEMFTVYTSQTEIMKEKKIIPFGTTETGKYICFKNDTIVLYSVDHDAEKLIAPSFSAFLELLQ